MRRDTISRRRFGAAIATASALAVAGCQDLTGGNGDGNGNGAGDGNGNGAGDGNEDDDGSEDGSEDGEFEPSEESVLTINLENEDGEAVHSGVAVTVETDGWRTNLGEESNQEGVMTVTTSQTGEFTITAESTEDEFEPVEETVTLEEGDEVEVTLTLEGASGGGDGGEGEDDE